MRALASGDLHAIRDNRNAWQINIDDLEAWNENRSGQSPGRLQVSDRTRPVIDRPKHADQAIMSRLAVAEARLSDVIAERDRLAALLEKALESKPGILRRLFRR